MTWVTWVTVAHLAGYSRHLSPKRAGDIGDSRVLLSPMSPPYQAHGCQLQPTPYERVTRVTLVTPYKTLMKNLTLTCGLLHLALRQLPFELNLAPGRGQAVRKWRSLAVIYGSNSYQ